MVAEENDIMGHFLLCMNTCVSASLCLFIMRGLCLWLTCIYPWLASIIRVNQDWKDRRNMKDRFTAKMNTKKGESAVSDF